MFHRPWLVLSCLVFVKGEVRDCGEVRLLFEQPFLVYRKKERKKERKKGRQQADHVLLCCEKS